MANLPWFSHTGSFHKRNPLRQSGLARDQKAKLFWWARACCSAPRTLSAEDETSFPGLHLFLSRCVGTACVASLG